jgi:hypothetical protein
MARDFLPCAQCLERPATMVLLDENAIKSMAPGRFFRDHKGAVNSLDFHHTEDVMVTVGTFDRPAKNPGVLPHRRHRTRVDLCAARDRAGKREEASSARAPARPARLARHRRAPETPKRARP